MENELIKCFVLSNGLDSNIDDIHSIDEFISLLKEAGFSCEQTFFQKMNEIDKKTYAGRGKIQEIKDYYRINERNDVSYLACNFELTAVQKKNIEDITGLHVIDRTFVILTIFEANAKTKEAKLQVEVAKLNYLKAHLIDNKASYSQVTSGSGHNKGSGEKQIELSRRLINDNIHLKERELEKIKLSRRNMRNERSNSIIPKIAIVGYTNAGKSTLMNTLLSYAKKKENKKVLERNSLFATLETSTRLISCYSYPSFFLTDTVGFVSDLPIYLVDAFRSTLEEIKEADLIIHVVDISNSYKDKQIETTLNVLKDLKADSIPTMYLFNKYDLLDKAPSYLLKDNEMFASLKDDEDIEEVIKFICLNLAKKWEKETVLFPYSQDFNSFLSDNYVVSYEQKENGYLASVYFNPKTLYKYGHLIK